MSLSRRVSNREVSLVLPSGGLWWLAWVLAAVALAGCSGHSAGKPLLRSGSEIHLKIQDREIIVELALDADSRARGLMFRQAEDLPPDRGMLFISPRAEKLSFYMRNTDLPLSIAFVDEDGIIQQIEDMRPRDETFVLSKKVLRYALEMNQGWFERNGIEVGHRFVDFEELVGSLRTY
jgi:uncharacterized membrane protein (UPF0127 family)